MKTINPETKAHKLLTALRSGNTYTFSSARKNLGIGNVRAEATRLRQAGFVINTVNRVAGNGVEVTEYKLGRPTRELIAAGYRAIQLGLV
jgi:hypothetical protein